MGRILLSKIKDSLLSLLPVTLIVLIICLTPLVNANTKEVFVFLMSAILLIIGMTLFNLGSSLAMRPMGEHIGAGLTKTRKVLVLIGVCFIMGLLITVAEPDLSVLAEQVSEMIKKPILIISVGAGVGIFLVLALLKIVFKKNLSMLLMFFYLLVFALCAILFSLNKGSIIALSFDSGGVTTGPITVPFIMALGLGVASTIGGNEANENSFGLVAMCSIGPIIALLLISIISNSSMTYVMSDYSVEDNLNNLGRIILNTSIDIFEALGLIVLFFLILQLFILKLPKKKLYQIFLGIIFTYVGLVIFLCAVQIGFMPIGYKLGTSLASINVYIVIIFGFLIGLVTVLAEPAVYVLNQQVEYVTEGVIKKKEMIIALSIGVGLSIGLSIIRILFNFSILYYLIPGYILSLGLSFFVPRIYTAIAFDSGGVASGPVTSSLILPMCIGLCANLHGEDSILSLAFGIVAMVAMAPLITIQILGFKSIAQKTIREKINMKNILDKDDEEIIYF